jgi:hypothetical protein
MTPPDEKQPKPTEPQFVKIMNLISMGYHKRLTYSDIYVIIYHSNSPETFIAGMENLLALVDADEFLDKIKKDHYSAK